MRTPAAAAALAIALALAGCAAGSPPRGAECTGDDACVASSGSPATSSAATSTASPNRLQRFDAAARAAIARYGHPTGAQFVAAEVAAGFSANAMQVTPDRTSANLTPGSILFSALVDGTCLIGQFGDEVGGYHSTQARPISTGQCLIGAVPSAG